MKCKRNFSYVELLFSIWSFCGYKRIECKNCNVALKINNVSRLIIAVLIPLPLLVQTYLLKLGINILVFYLLYLSFIIVLSPLIVRYKLIE
ncbi:TIGR04104 family putative zinc finger protein [uncultured Clostridium sp.]|uniref:TIGR04104 family putative zinc finger protein n=1 Tax=uncultured Clostridium sp. TaxID=59620 RepID=UPI00258CE984|nr:TIGR04104 family putative zinc finger protein [uncultured Clostridium sp.]